MTTIRFTVRDADRGDVDVVGEFAPDASPSDLRDALSRTGFHISSVALNGTHLVDSLPLVDQGFVRGAVVAEPRLAVARPPGPGYHVVVVGGPEAGRWARLEPDRPLRVGRTAGDLKLERDGLTSRSHAEVRLSGSTIVITDLGSTNGVLVEGIAISAPTEIAVGGFVHLGSSVISVVYIDERDVAPLGRPDGSAFVFPRTFREAQEPLETEVSVPKAPTEPDRGGLGWWRSLIPLVGGVGFALITRNPLFLLVAGLTPLIYAGDAYRQHRQRTHSSKAERTRHGEDAARARQRFAAIVAQERRRARAASPFGGTAALYAAVRHRRIWERRASDSDFMAVTVGLATRPSTVRIEEDDGTGRRTTPEPVWGMPVDVNLRQTGSLAVLGDPTRSRAVVRSMLAALAVTHSPTDLQIWLFTDASVVDEWRPVRWLPHVMVDDETCRIASSAIDRSTLLVRLKQELDRRRELQANRRDQSNLPVHVVVFDGVDLVSPGDLSGALSRGPDVGIVGIVIDAGIAPEGVMATVTVGQTADEGVFESRHQPRISGLLTAEMPTDVMERCGRRLAGLRPPLLNAGLGVDQRLVEALAALGVTGAELAQRWATSSGQTRALVGSCVDTPFLIDVARDGPHGLVGGMTRSGKTEFLKTLITSLAWTNHPDDLSFVIVDFKGGVDYTLAAELPHVLEVSSNQDIGGFERTVRLLAAELRRRQLEFERVRVANLDAYRAARRTDHSLAPIPRLVVLIDEFGELRSSDVGQDQLRQIESMARIGGGLGVHLLLITQNFEGQLPGQVEANAGLRICFRVEDASHSRIVIGTGVAAEIPATAKGRGYARLQGRDPVEFQTARVAGMRRDLDSRQTPASLRLQPFETLMLAFATDVPTDVRAEDTDMAGMIGVIQEAASWSGWEKPSIPWPAPLPDDLALVQVARRSDRPSVGIGLVDHPDQQRQVPYMLDFDGGHVAFIGGASADLATALMTVAVSATVSFPVDDVHLYVIDFAGRGLARLGALPHCGGVASRNDALAGRIARHLADEIAERRSRLASAGVSTLEEYTTRTGETFPHILLLVAGAERLSSVASHDEPSVAGPPLTSIVVDGVGLGIQVIGAGLPAFVAYRPGSYIEHRVVFTSADVSEYLGLGCPRALLGEVRGPRRGVDLTAQALVQIASLAGGETSEADAFDALAVRLREHFDAATIRRPPRRFREVSWPVSIASVLDAAAHGSAGTLFVGVNSTGGDLVEHVPARGGRTLFVAGPRGSGRSTTLIACGQMARVAGWDVVAVAALADSPLASMHCPFERARTGDLGQRLARTERPTLLLVDDADQLGELAEDGQLVGLEAADAVIFAGSVSSFGGSQRAITNTGAERARAGIALRPSRYEDVEVLGGTHDDLNRVGRDLRPGQGLFGDGSRVIPITVPLPGP